MGDYEMLEQLTKNIREWVFKSEKPVIIGVSGHGAAGKTTFVSELIEQFEPHKVNYINTDPYIVDSTIRKKTIIQYTYENEPHSFKMTACHPGAHHLPSLERDVRMIREGVDFYTIDVPYLERTLISAQNQLTIVEGMSVAFLQPKYFDITIYFYTDGDTEFKRRSERDTNERGMNIDYLRQSHEERRIQYEVFMHPYREQFDVVINTTNEGIVIEKMDLNLSKEEM